MNAAKLLAKYEMLAEAAHRTGAYKCARKWSIKAEKLEAVISALETIEEQTMKIDDRIPQTLEQARDLAEARFATWNETSRELVQKVLNSGVAPRDGQIIRSHPCFQEVDAFARETGDCRVNLSIGRVAEKLAK